MNLKARFFQLYPGETVKIDLLDDNWRLAKMNCVDRGVVITDEGGFLLEKCQLVLSPLSEITDRMAVKMAEVEEPSVKWRLKDRVGSLVRLWAGDEYEITLALNLSFHFITMKFLGDTSDFDQYALVDFLRMNGFAVPFGGKNPFSEGWAISELPAVPNFTSL